MRFGAGAVKAALIILVGLGFAVPVPAVAQDVVLLFAEPDESSLEIEIRRFLLSRSSWPVRISDFPNVEGDDALLHVELEVAGETREFSIDTLSSARDNTERRIKIYGWYFIGITENHRQRRQVLEAINEYNNTSWGPRIWLDDDGDLAFDWSINIPGPNTPIHAEMVYDGVYRLKIALDGLIPKLRELGIM
jgi:Putative bacterial sensory transduction regulator